MYGVKSRTQAWKGRRRGVKHGTGIREEGMDGEEWSSVDIGTVRGVDLHGDCGDESIRKR